LYNDEKGQSQAEKCGFGASQSSPQLQEKRMKVPEDEGDKLTDFKYEDDDASLPLKDSEKMRAVTLLSPSQAPTTPGTPPFEGVPAISWPTVALAVAVFTSLVILFCLCNYTN